VNALLREISIRSKNWKEYDFTSLYFGGGTPSFLNIGELKLIMDTLYLYFKFTKNVEVTLEINPENVTEKYARELIDLDINRVSMGVQSFSNSLLQSLGRIHSAEKAELAVNILQEVGFRNISIDLMFGLPNQGMGIWEETLQQAFKKNITHVSAYLLSVEPNTDFFNRVANKKIFLPDEDLVIEQYNLLCDLAKEYGYEHYEISNFALPEFKSKHNSSYWQGTPYLGVGPSAHSYNGVNNRSWNVNDIEAYINAITQGELLEHSEQLQLVDRMNDYIITRLRTIEGFTITDFRLQFGPKYASELMCNAQNLLLNSGLHLIEDKFFIAEKEMIISDKIIRDLLFV
jgi:oxygen-independent coproporphyrinogen-3 oxidase